jgi:phosphate transport system substrate-binding protein
MWLGQGGRGGDGPAAIMKSRVGSIAHLELAYAIQNNLAYAAVRNRDGQFVLPTVDGTTSAISHSRAALQRDVRSPIVNAYGANSYPICGLTYVLLYRNERDKTKAKALFDFVQWSNGMGQGYAKTLYYAPLPLSLRQINERKLRALRTQLLR